MRTRLLSLCIGAALLAGPALFSSGFEPGSQAFGADGKLGKLESKLKSGSSRRSYSGGEKALIAHLLIDFFVHVAPYLLFPRDKFYHQGYPYELGDGYLEFIGDSRFARPGGGMFIAHPVAFEARGGYQIDSAELHGYRFYGKARLSWAFNLDVDVTQFREWRSLYAFDTLTFTKFDGLFNLSSSPWHDIDLGFGFSYLDGVDLFGGVNAKITGDIFPGQPLGIHFSAAANAFPGGTLMETEILLGIFLKRVELRLGWRALWVEDVEISGPITEVAIWF
jgi:hypothetical protein